MKKCGVLLLILFCCYQTSRATFSTVAITSGFNADIIANGTGNASASATAFDVPNGYAFVSADFQAVLGNAAPTYAFPSNGLINSATTTGLSFQLGSYTTNNALLLTETNGTGTLNMSVSNVADLYFLVSSANGSSDFTATIHFSDATTQTSNTLAASDWYSNPNYAMKGVGRVALSDNSLDGDGDNPRIYQVVLHLDPANYAKTISSISFSSTESNGTTMAVMGVSANSTCSGSPASASTLSTAASVCPGVVFTLSLSNTYTDGGITYQWESSDNNSVWTPIANATNATLVTNEAVATYYHCVVTCAGSGLAATSSSTLVALNSGTTCYCIPSYSTGCSDMFGAYYDINSVVLNGDNGTSINNSSTGCSVANAYTDYTSSVSAISLTPYTDYVINLTTQSTSGSPSATVWIDLNDDGTFNDTTERVGTTGTSSGLSIPINIPAATAGNHRMRISTVFFYGFTVDQPCGAYLSGETEDYMVNLLPTPTCIHPMNLTTTTVNQTDINASWIAGSSGTTYDYAIDQSATAEPDGASTITNTANNSVTLAAVAPATTFYFHLRAHCSANDSSIWISKAFTLASTCANATSLSINNTTFGNSSSFADVTLPSATCGDATGAVSHGMWYKVAPATSGQLVVYTTIGTTFDSYLRVYSGSCVGLTCVGFNDNYSNGNTSSISFSATANTTYYILMTGVNPTDSGNYLLTVQAGPSNDEAVNATVLTPGAGCSGATYTNLGATASTGEPYPKCSGFSAISPVWFSFVAPSNGTAKITTDYTSGTLTDSKLALFSATDVTNYSTFTLIGCDDNNGVTGSGQLSTLYATDLTPGATYYIAMDNGLSAPAQGTFCITVDAINPSFLSSAATSCESFQTPDGFNPTYTGWVSLVDNNGNLVAMVRNQNGGAVANYSGAYTLYGNGIRQDANGRYYMNRNYFISNPSISTPVDLKLFFSPADYGYLSGISGGTGNPITMNDLNVTKQEGSTCAADYSEGLGAVSVLLQTGNNSANSVGWINLTTSSFSNFYIMAGNTPLLIELKTFAAENLGLTNKVTWSTATENTGDYFELERSADGKTFGLLSKITSHQKPSDYVYNDNNPLAGINYYRLKLINANDKTTYSNVVRAKVSADETATISAYPNPVGKQIKLHVTGTQNGTVTLTDISGRTLYQSSMNGNEMSIDMSAFANGFYLIHYVDDHLNKVIKINKQ